jgi:hypothetical protein
MMVKARIIFEGIDVGINEIDNVIMQGITTLINRKLLSIKAAIETAEEVATTVRIKEMKRTFLLFFMY